VPPSDHLSVYMCIQEYDGTYKHIEHDPILYYTTNYLELNTGSASNLSGNKLTAVYT